MSQNIAGEYFLLLFSEKYPDVINQYNKGSILYLFNNEISKYFNIGLDLQYYFDEFINNAKITNPSDFNAIFNALGTYLNNFIYLSKHPELLSIINKSNDSLKLDNVDYLKALEHTLYKKNDVLTEGNMTYLLDNLHRLKKIFAMETSYYVSVMKDYPLLNIIFRYYCDKVNINIMDYIYKKEIKTESPTPVVKNVPKPQKNVGHPNTYKLVFSYIGCGKNDGETKEEFQEKLDKWNYIISSLNPKDLNGIRVLFGSKFNYPYYSNSNLFSNGISPLYDNEDYYNANIDYNYVNIDYNQNLYTILNTIDKSIIEEYLLEMAEEELTFLGNFYDLKTGDLIFNSEINIKSKVHLSKIFMDINIYNQNIQNKYQKKYFVI